MGRKKREEEVFGDFEITLPAVTEDSVDLEYMSNPNSYGEKVRKEAEIARLNLVALCTDSKVAPKDRISASKELLRLAGNIDGGLVGVTREEVEEYSTRQLEKMLKAFEEDMRNQGLIGRTKVDLLDDTGE